LGCRRCDGLQRLGAHALPVPALAAPAVAVVVDDAGATSTAAWVFSHAGAPARGCHQAQRLELLRIIRVLRRRRLRGRKAGRFAMNVDRAEPVHHPKLEGGSGPAAGQPAAIVILGLQTLAPLSALLVKAWSLASFPPCIYQRPLAAEQPKEMIMSNQVTQALHDVHTATNDVLKGYREMAARAEPDIQAIIQRLIDMHQRHASEQEAELGRLRDAGKDDSSWQGTVNKAVVIVRDWVSDLDRDVLPAVRQGEESLRNEYVKALEDVQVREQPWAVALLKTQHDAIASEIALLPKG